MALAFAVTAPGSPFALLGGAAMNPLLRLAPAPEPRVARSERCRTGPRDEELVIAARARETWAQEALFRRYGRMVNVLAHRLLGYHDEVDDVVQDAFVEAFTRIDGLREPAAFSSWLGAITVRLAQRRLRRQRLLARLGLRSLTFVDPESIPIDRDAPPEMVTELRRIYGILNSLSVEERLALVLRRIEGLDMAEIAERMQVSLSTVKRRLRSAEARLRERLGEGRRP